MRGPAFPEGAAVHRIVIVSRYSRDGENFHLPRTRANTWAGMRRDEAERKFSSPAQWSFYRLLRFPVK